MTLVAVHVRADRIEVLTDTMGGLPDDTRSHPMTKCDVVPHRQMAIAAVGQYALQWEARNLVTTGLHGDHDLDSAVEAAEGVLTPVWKGLPDAFETTLFLLGWSNIGGRFTGYELRWTYEGFTRRRLDDEFVSRPPAPKRLHRGIPNDETDWRLHGDLVRAMWMPPASERIVPIGGELWLTTLTDGEIVQRRIHTFDDTIWRTIIAAGGLGDRGHNVPPERKANLKTADDLLDRVLGSPPATSTAGGSKVPRNAPCPCRSGRKFKLCCGR